MNDASNVNGGAAVAGAATCSAEPPLCINCKWMTLDSDDGTELCKRPGQGTKNVVNGGMLYKSCADQREDHDWIMDLFFGKSCGVAAKYFQPNDKLSDGGHKTL